MKMFHTILNIIMGSGLGVFAGMSIYQCYDYYAHPKVYEWTSAPWYTSILLHGIFTAALLVICGVIKAIIKHTRPK